MTNKALLILLSGILIRLFLMPWFAHEDIFSDYRRAEQMAFADKSVFAVNTIVPHIIETANLKFFSLFTGENFFKQVHFDLIDQRNINAHLFIFKIPYLIIEIITWLLFIKFFKPTNKLLGLLVFNPIIIYSVYMFGRYESFILFFELLLLISLQKNSKFMALFWSVIILLSRVSLALVMPAFALLKLKIKDYLAMLAVLIPVLFLGKNLILSKLPSIINGQHFAYLFASKINVFELEIYLFPALYLIFFIILAVKFRKNQKISNINRFAIASVLFLFAYYITSLFHPQYFSWFILPFLYLLTQFNESKLLKILFILLNLLFFFWILYWDGFTNIGLLFPIFSNFISVNPQAILPIDIQEIANIAKNMMAMIMLGISYLILKESDKLK